MLMSESTLVKMPLCWKSCQSSNRILSTKKVSLSGPMGKLEIW